MPVTQSHIAKKLGISSVAVSHALRGTDQVSEATRRRVVKAAQRMGYRLNASARSTATGRFGALGFCCSVDNKKSWYPGELIEGIQDALDERNLRLTMARLHDDQLTDLHKLPSILSENCIDGLLLNYISDAPAKMSELLDHLAVPHIWINVDHHHDTVRIDDEASIRLAVDKAIEAGHTKIAYMHLRARDSHYSVSLRCAAYEQCMTEADLSPVILTADQTVPAHDMTRYALEFLRIPDRPTAIITYGDEEAGALLFAAMQMQVDVPGHISVINSGFEYQVPVMLSSLTRVILPERRIGRTAVTELMNKIEDPATQRTPKLIQPSWHAGQTLASPH